MTVARASACLCFLVGAVFASDAAWTGGKAHVAQRLLERAWQRARSDGEAEPPWPWADTRPVARLEIPSRDASLIVLDGASGEALAFGPGRVAGEPADPSGTFVVGGHRDSHLAFLADLPVGATLWVENLSGVRQRYRLTSGRVIDSRRETVAVSHHAPGLVLITCWPFDAARAGGPLRYIVTGEPDPPQAKSRSSPAST